MGLPLPPRKPGVVLVRPKTDLTLYFTKIKSSRFSPSSSLKNSRSKGFKTHRYPLVSQPHIKLKYIQLHSKSNKTRNKLIKSYNGNILKLMHLNKSSSKILTKISLIQDLLDLNSPDICSLNESNCDLNEQAELNPIKGYSMEHKLLTLGGVSTSVARTSN